jgi:hypothetical protein
MADSKAKLKSSGESTETHFRDVQKQMILSNRPKFGDHIIVLKCEIML